MQIFCFRTPSWEERVMTKFIHLMLMIGCVTMISWKEKTTTRHERLETSSQGYLHNVLNLLLWIEPFQPLRIVMIIMFVCQLCIFVPLSVESEHGYVHVSDWRSELCSVILNYLITEVLFSHKLLDLGHKTLDLRSTIVGICANKGIQTDLNLISLNK